MLTMRAVAYAAMLAMFSHHGEKLAGSGRVLAAALRRHPCSARLS
jgi:hypothetical protein